MMSVTSGIDLSRPFRAYDIDEQRTQGVALGWIMTPPWGCVPMFAKDL